MSGSVQVCEHLLDVRLAGEEVGRERPRRTTRGPAIMSIKGVKRVQLQVSRRHPISILVSGMGELLVGIRSLVESEHGSTYRCLRACRRGT